MALASSLFIPHIFIVRLPRAGYNKVGSLYHVGRFQSAHRLIRQVLQESGPHHLLKESSARISPINRSIWFNFDWMDWGACLELSNWLDEFKNASPYWPFRRYDIVVGELLACNMYVEMSSGRPIALPLILTIWSPARSPACAAKLLETSEDMKTLLFLVPKDHPSWLVFELDCGMDCWIVTICPFRLTRRFWLAWRNELAAFKSRIGCPFESTSWSFGRIPMPRIWGLTSLLNRIVPSWPTAAWSMRLVRKTPSNCEPIDVPVPCWLAIWLGEPPTWPFICELPWAFTLEGLFGTPGRSGWITFWICSLMTPLSPPTGLVAWPALLEPWPCPPSNPPKTSWLQDKLEKEGEIASIAQKTIFFIMSLNSGTALLWILKYSNP